MNSKITFSPKLLSPSSLTVIPVFEGELKPSAKPAPRKGSTQATGLGWALSSLSPGFRATLLKAAREEGFQGKRDQLFLMHTQGRLASPRVILIGLGSRSAYVPETLRLAAGLVAKRARKASATAVKVALPETRTLHASLEALVEGFLLGEYSFDRYRTKKPDAEPHGPAGGAELKIALPPGLKPDDALRASSELAQRVAAAVSWARDRVNEPASVLTPTQLAKDAEELAARAGLKAEVVGRKEIEKLKMGMFLGVAQGSAEPPRLIHLEYQPKHPRADAPAGLALVGKAITFDSGGHSLKTSEGMLDMKSDMAGSAAVFGAMEVIAWLAPPFPVHAFVGACENMLDATAYKLGDILTSRLGKTVEVHNTDAEGRLVLGDILAYANEIKPEMIVDLATLTGACMVALGRHIAGAFGVDEGAVNAVLRAGVESGEELWRLPVTDLQRDQLKSDIADLKNVGERHGGALNAALFLKEFVGKTPWVHLDIAGPSFGNRERGYIPKGGTGFGVRTLVELVRQRARELQPPQSA